MHYLYIFMDIFMVHVTCSAVFSQPNFAYCNILLCGFQSLVMLQSFLYFFISMKREMQN